jgi:hypothetical protein
MPPEEPVTPQAVLWQNSESFAKRFSTKKIKKKKLQQ